jgi:hypothetical protein
VHYGMLSLVGLGCIGLCLAGWRICMLVGRRKGALRVRFVEDDSFMSYVVFMEQKKCKML